MFTFEGPYCHFHFIILYLLFIILFLSLIPIYEINMQAYNLE